MKNIYRSAVTGQLVTKKFAKENPDTTVKETITDIRKILIEFCDFLEANGRTIDYSKVDEFLEQR